MPLFHCNGWTHAWALTITGGTAFLIRQVNARAMFDAIAEHGITHMGGAPTVLGMLADAPEDERRPLPGTVHVMTAGAPPPAAVLERVERLGFEVLQVYGLTETTGHVVHCAWEEEWNDLPDAERADLKARQGVRMPITEWVGVVDVETGEQVPADGTTTGEIVIRGNTVMQGYLHDEAATEAAFAGGVFHSGDIAVVHPDGRIQVRDRLKDVIISGGENVSSVEVEGVLHRHPAVATAAVVAKPDDRWGEVPCAFVELRPGAVVTEAELIAFCRERLAGFKTPKARRLRRHPEDGDRQDPEVRAARARARGRAELSVPRWEVTGARPRTRNAGDCVRRRRSRRRPRPAGAGCRPSACAPRPCRAAARTRRSPRGAAGSRPARRAAAVAAAGGERRVGLLDVVDAVALSASSV